MKTITWNEPVEIVDTGESQYKGLVEDRAAALKRNKGETKGSRRKAPMGGIRVLRQWKELIKGGGRGCRGGGGDGWVPHRERETNMNLVSDSHTHRRWEPRGKTKEERFEE